MFDFLKNISDKNYCQSEGVCSIDPTVSALEEVVLEVLKEACFYILKLHDFNLVNREIEGRVIKALSVIMLNTSFDKQEFLNFFNSICEDKKAAKEKYISYCKENHINCELMNVNEQYCNAKTLNTLIELGENKMQNKYKGVERQKMRMFELITLFAKTSAIVLELLKKVEDETSYFEFEIIRFFALTSRFSTRSEKLKRRILEFSKLSFELQKLTNKAYENRWGKRQNAKVSISAKKGASILVSGPDLMELELLLDTIGERKINVYTNSVMFAAHTYPIFKMYSNLVGHLDSSDTSYDFSNFPGAVLITQNFSQKIDNLMRGNVFSNKVITPNRVFKIKNNNYEPLIEAALKLEGFRESQNEEFIEISHSVEEIDETLKELKDKGALIIVGENATSENVAEFNGKKIINLDCPIESDLIIHTLEKCDELDIKTDIFFTSCSIGGISTLLSTLFMGLNGIWLAGCSSSFINPHVNECLEKDFGVKTLN